MYYNYNTNEPFSYEEWKKQQAEFARVSRLRKEINKSGISDDERASLHDGFARLAKQMQRRAS